MRNPSACSGVPVVHDGAPPSRAVNALAEAPFKGNIIGAVVDDVVLLSEDVGPVRRLTLNRPRSLNALNKELHEATLELADQIAMNEPHVVAATKRAVNRVWEVAGFRDAMDANVEIDVDIETANLPMREEFRRITQERGLKAAIAWRDAQYRGDT